MNKYILDSYAMIAFFEDEPGAGKVDEILGSINAKTSRGYMSVVNWGEVYYNTARENGVEEAEKVLAQFDKYAIQLIDVDRALAYRAAKFKSKYHIAYADCFAAALSLKLSAPLVTGDPEFKKLSREISIEWID